MRRNLLAVMVAGSVALGGSSILPSAALAAPTRTTTTVTASAFDGRTLYEGLTFDIGPAAAAFPSLVLTKQHPSIDLANKIQETTARIAATDPAVFSSFKAAVTSGNPYTISKGIDAANKAFVEAGKATGVLRIDAPNDGKCIVVVVAAAGAVVVAAVLYKVKLWAAESDSDRSVLAQQEWIQRLATTLH